MFFKVFGKADKPLDLLAISSADEYDSASNKSYGITKAIKTFVKR
jgi:hypothetical protein